MKMGQGVEWALHSCVNMSWTPVGEAVSSARLAAFYKLPAAYLNKQLQALVRAGILASYGATICAPLPLSSTAWRPR